MRLLSAALAAILTLMPCLALVSRASAQILANGGFEDGASGWSGSGMSMSGCGPRSGSGALALTIPAPRPAIAVQSIETAALAGPYVLNGYARAGSGGPMTVTARLQWTDDQGALLREAGASLSATGTYQAFAVSTSGDGVAGATTLTVRLMAEGSGTACIDDVTLEGPLPATATPVPTATPSPLPTPTETQTPSPAAASSTPRPPTSTRAPTSTKTPAATRTATASSGSKSSSGSAISDGIINGGFEGGVAPWQKVGGELGIASSPVNSGASSGALASATSSTKWAFQVVRVGEGSAYEFEGYVLPDAGVAEAWLRISWFASADGSGSATGNTDSTARVAGGAAGFSYLTTGAVQAPPGAASARVRVMLAPTSAGRSVLYMDDLSFGPSTAPPRNDAVAPATAADNTTESDTGSTGPVEIRTPDVSQQSSGSRVPAGATFNAVAAGDAGDIFAPSSDVLPARQAVGGGGASVLDYVLTASVIAAGVAALTAWWVRRRAGTV